MCQVHHCLAAADRHDCESPPPAAKNAPHNDCQWLAGEGLFDGAGAGGVLSIDMDHGARRHVLHGEPADGQRRRSLRRDATAERLMKLTVLEGPDNLEPESGDEALKRLYRYWLERRGGKRFPSREDIDPLDFRYALGRVSLIEVLENPRRFRYRLVSTALTTELGYEMTGKSLDDIPETEMRGYAAALYGAALNAGTPVHIRDAVTLDGRRWTHETLVLPLSSTDLAIDILMIYRTAEASSPSRPTTARPRTELEYLERVDVPLLNELMAYWNARRGARLAPRRADIDPADLKAHLSRLVMLDVIDGGADFRYRLIGSALTQAMGRDSTGHRIGDLYAGDPAVMDSLRDYYRRVVAEARPIFTQGHIFWVPDRGHRRFITAAMPLSDDGTTVNMILAEVILLRT
jgi:hypothetical protein